MWTFALSYDSGCCFFLITSFFFFLKLIIFIPCSLRNTQNFFMQFYTSYLFPILLNADIVDIEKPDGIWIIFTSINFLYYTFKICINNKWCFIRFLILIKFQYYFHILFYAIQVCFLF